ncbi:MAG: hypothetical protein LBE78_02825 [Burkholderiaceae bacterium]|jgi:hypothetical protein|nr:hypothetical protein [Burkholderiaceae bacterium]
MSRTPSPAANPESAEPFEQHPSELETSVETIAAEVMVGLGLQQPEPEVPLPELARLEQINAEQPLPEEDLARQALEAGGDDDDPNTPE